MFLTKIRLSVFTRSKVLSSITQVPNVMHSVSLPTFKIMKGGGVLSRFKEGSLRWGFSFTNLMTFRQNAFIRKTEKAY